MEARRPRTLFYAWPVTALDDARLEGCSVLARHLYDRALLAAKRSGTAGVIGRRQLVSAVVGPDGISLLSAVPDGPELTPAQVSAAIAELVDNGLAVEDDGALGLALAEPLGGAADDRSETARRLAQSEAGHRTNHRRGLHDNDARPGCPLCQASTVKTAPNPVTAPAPNHDRAVTAPEPDRSTAGTEQNRAEQSTTEQRVAPQAEGSTQDAPGPRSTARHLVAASLDPFGAGDDIEPPTDFEIGLVAAALQRGHTVADLARLATASRDTSILEPRRWLHARWGQLAATSPPPAARPQARRLALVHPEPCPAGCDDGWITTDDGLIRCDGTTPTETRAAS